MRFECDTYSLLDLFALREITSVTELHYDVDFGEFSIDGARGLSPGVISLDYILV